MFEEVSSASVSCNLNILQARLSLFAMRCDGSLTATRFHKVLPLRGCGVSGSVSSSIELASTDVAVEMEISESTKHICM